MQSTHIPSLKATRDASMRIYLQSGAAGNESWLAESPGEQACLRAGALTRHLSWPRRADQKPILTAVYRLPLARPVAGPTPSILSALQWSKNDLL